MSDYIINTIIPTVLGIVMLVSVVTYFILTLRYLFNKTQKRDFTILGIVYVIFGIMVIYAAIS